jgi:phosphatidyl-myo-inositol dimannoside synthase
MPPHGGGIERYSADVLGAVQPFFKIYNLSNSGGPLTQLPYLLGIRSRVRRVSKSEPNLVIDGCDAAMGIALAPLPLPKVIRVVGLDLVYPSSIYQMLLRKAILRMDYVVACSHPTRLLLDRFSFPKNRSFVVWPAAEAPPGWVYRPVPGRILMAGRLVRRKNVEGFVQQVWPLVQRELPGAELHIVGDGPQYAEVLAAARAAKTPGKITIHGRVSQSALEDAYRTADVFVMNNQPLRGDFEGFGIVAAEAAARGIPVVARAVQGVVDAVAPGSTGYLVDPVNHEEMASRIVAIVEGQLLRNRQAVAAAAKLRYGYDRLAREYGRVVTLAQEES